MTTLAEFIRWITYCLASAYHAVAISTRRDKIVTGTERRLRALLESSPDAMIIVNGHGHITTVNGDAERMFGHRRAAIVGQNLTDLLVRRDRDAHRVLHRSFLREDGTAPKRAKRELVGLSHDGSEFPIEMSLSSMATERGPLLFVAVRDITERKQLEGRLQHLADHDPLTGMFNRRRFEEELTSEIERACRRDADGAVLAIDVDNFKHVNDTLGHAVGDDLIVRVSELLRSRLRADDTIGRLGGDEFAVILAGVDLDGAVTVAQGLRGALLEECRLDMVNGPPRRVTASIGIAPFGGSSASADEVLVEADIAMYDAKDAGRDRVRLYRPDADRQRTMHARITWADRILDAFEKGTFVLYAQPIVALMRDALPRYELLIRMLDDDGLPIAPGEFLPIAERSDLILEIDRWVLAEAVGLLAAERYAGRPIHLSVNLSAKSVSDPTLPALLAAHLAAAGIDGRGLCIELTETVAIVNVERARVFAKAVAALGCELALDDFGSGFASFYYLKHMDFNYIKIDGEFIRDLTTSPTNQLVVKALVDIARGLHQRTIAEFVEDAETLELLGRYGVDFAQGYHIGRPMPLSATGLSSGSILPTASGLAA